MNTYKDRLNKYKCTTLEDIIKLATNFIPIMHKRQPWKFNELKHGVNILESEEALDCYMASYGEMHYNKMRVALQNLPFEQLRGSIELVDWGCGQGIGALSAIEALKDRDLLPWLKRITLIEPSASALTRAEANVSHLTGNYIEINALNCYLPTDAPNDKSIKTMGYRCTHVIHIFSNILDIRSISLTLLARMIGTTGRHIIVCTGPLNSTAYRIKQFCSIFGNQDYFSEITNPEYSRISTGHTYSCITRCFTYNGMALDFNKMNTINQNDAPVYTDYDFQLKIQNKVMPQDKARIAYRLESIINSDDLIYYHTQVNESSIDFIILRRYRGVIIINVFDEDINNFDFEIVPNKKNIDSKDHQSETESRINKNILVKKGTNNTILSPIAQIDICQTNLKNSIEELLLKTIQDSKNFALIKKVVIFTKNTKDEIHAFFGSDNSYTSLYGKELIFDKEVSKQIYKDLYFKIDTNRFTDSIRNQIITLLSPKWHSYREGRTDIHLTPIQKELVMSRPTSQKISGVAGSGKTQVLITRAINAQKRTGGKVLILTYNITLANYITYRLHELREDFLWDKICIFHYHHFIRLQASKCKLNVSFNSYDNPNFFEFYADKVDKYSAIFIDEVQDYQTTWLKILQKYFLEEKGEFVVFGDPKQNLYQRPLDKNGNIRLETIIGSWNQSLKEGKRFTNPMLARIAVKFQKEFQDKLIPDSITTSPVQQLNFRFNVASYHDIRNDNSSIENVVNKCVQIIAASGIQAKDFVILGATTVFLREFDYIYRKSTFQKTETSFIRKELYDKLCSIHGITNGKAKAGWRFARDLEALDRIRKYNFSSIHPVLKLSTIQSFKGWESPAVILLLEKKEEPEKAHERSTFNPYSPEAMYTALTRAREFLCVVNIGNDQYHNFLSNVLL